MNKLVSLFGLATISVLGLACGGGGGSSAGGASAVTITPSTTGSTTNTTNRKFYLVDYTEPTVNGVTVTGTLMDSVSIDAVNFKGQTSSAKDLIVVARASTTSSPPEMILALQGGGTTSALSGNFQGAVYGIGTTGASKVATGQVNIDFSTTQPTVAAQGDTTTEFTSFMLPSLQTQTISVSSTGVVTWGNWTGQVNETADMMLLTNGQMFLLAAKMSLASAPHHRAEVTTTRSFAGLLQIDGISGSTLGTLDMSSGSPTLKMEDKLLTLTGGSGLATNSFGRNSITITGSGNNIVELSDAGTGILEQGFMAPRDFFVIINHNSLDRPTFSVILLP